MKPLYDAHIDTRQAALQRMQQSNFLNSEPAQSDMPEPQPIESSTIWRFTMVAGFLMVLAIILSDDTDLASTNALDRPTAYRVQV
ncbi:TPA: hypothetical protein QDB14_002931 [Burkholderia vietnamiensis]|nr:hypothetical protein [Burkholderia vietnamiensis]